MINIQNVSGSPGKRKKNKGASIPLPLVITYINVCLYALCYQLQRPVEPFLVKSLTSHGGDGSFGADATAAATAYGRVQSFFSAVQTIGSPLVGILLDRIGIRRTSALVFGASALSYAILSQATDLSMLFLSKVPTILQHAFLVAQATAATESGSDDALRAQALGRMTTAYTIGATLGPALGGYLANGDGEQSGDLYVSAKLAVFGSLLSVALSWIFLSDEHYHVEKTQNSISSTSVPRRSFIEDVKKMARIGVRPKVWPLLMVKVVGGIARSMHSTALPIALTQYLDFDPSQLGYVMSCASFAVALFGAIAMKALTNALGSNVLARVGLSTRALLSLVIAHLISSSTMSSVQTIAIASIAHALASHTLATSLTTLTTGAVAASERGTLLGLEHGLFSAVGVVAPTAGTSLLATGGSAIFWYVALSCASIDAALVGTLFL